MYLQPAWTRVEREAEETARHDELESCVDRLPHGSGVVKDTPAVDAIRRGKGAAEGPVEDRTPDHAPRRGTAGPFTEALGDGDRVRVEVDRADRPRAFEECAVREQPAPRADVEEVVPGESASGEALDEGASRLVNLDIGERGRIATPVQTEREANAFPGEGRGFAVEESCTQGWELRARV
jgi:hypothetical protein